MWTKEQKAVIDNRNSNLLVSAAAGSGKTAVLIERIIQLVLDEKNPVDIDKLLVVTFTKAAASEMRERVSIAIEKALEENPKNEHLQKQMALLNKADICTIDSFCGNVLKNNFHLTDLEPSVKVADPTEIEIISREVMEDLFESLYEEENEEFLKLVDWYSGKTNDDSLVDLILTVHNFTNSSPYPKKWLNYSAELFNTEDKDDKFYIVNYIVPIIKEAKMEITYYLGVEKEIIDEILSYEELLEYIEITKERLGYAEKVNKNLHEMEKISNKKEFSSKEFISLWNDSNKIIEEAEEFASKVKIPAARKGVFSDEVLKIYKEVKKSISSKENSISKIYEHLKSISIDDIKEENDILYPYMKAVSNICIKFKEKLSEKKKYMGILDFADIEHYALDILTDIDENGDVTPSQVAVNYRDMYAEVFTDEYQDSNYVQEIILSMVSRENIPNRFMVGDVKQSIYRFRQAMPEIFMDKYENYDLYIEYPNSRNKKIMLYSNFRSRAEVLEGCNHVFSKIMRKETGEIDYTEEERLNPRANFKTFDKENGCVGGPIEVYLLSDDDKEELKDSNISSIEEYKITEEDEIDGLESFSKQCVYIANIIYKMVNPVNKENQYMIYDSKIDDYRPVQYRDIVILMRAPGKKAITLEEIMSYYDIPIYSEVGDGYFSTIEVDTIINLLRIIDNPIQDIPLISIMRSPIFGFTPSELAQIRLVDKGIRFYEAVYKIYNEEISISQNLKEKVVDFVNSIDRFRKKSLLMSVDEFIWYILRETGYFTYVGMLEMGTQRQNNLMLLFERARHYEKSSYKGIFNFINYIDRIKSRDTDLGEAKTISEEANVVRVMSIHKSKGLEFPVVIVANIEKKFNKSLGDSNLSLHQTMGYGPRILDNKRKVYFDSYTKKNIDMKREKEIIAEEMRLLYVAMTRAKEKLIFVGKIRNKDKEIEKWENTPINSDLQTDSGAVLSSTSYLDWIMPTIINLNSKSIYTNVRGENKTYVGYKECKWGINIDSYSEMKNHYEEIMNIKSSKINAELYKTSYKDSCAEKFDNEQNKFKSSHEEDNMVNTNNIVKELDNFTICEKIENTKLEKEDMDIINSIKKKLDSKFNTEYKFLSAASKPSSISVSEIKKIMNQDSEEEGMNGSIFNKNYSEDMKVPDFMHKGKNKLQFSAAERGTIFHLAMQLLEFKSFKGIEKDDEILKEIKNQLNQTIEKEIMTEEEVETIDSKRIMRFIKSDIFSEILKADLEERLYKEKAINYSIKIKSVYKDPTIDDSERMMMVGIIDLFYENENGNIVLMDYKTDYVENENYSIIIDRYKVQLEMYKKAMESISGKVVEKMYLYMFSTGKLLDIDFSLLNNEE